MTQMALARIVKVLEFTAMITQTSWVQNSVTVIQDSYNVDLLPTNAKLGRIVRIMEIIWLLETFVLSIQIFDGQYFLYEGRNCKLIAFHVSLQCLSMLI